MPSFIQFDSFEESSIAVPDYNDKKPNIRKIVETLASSNSSNVQSSLIIAIEEMVQLVDWKQKDSIRSQIKRACKRILQEEMSAVESAQLFETILNNLLLPSDAMTMV